MAEEAKKSEPVKAIEAAAAKEVEGVVIDKDGEEIEVAGHLFTPVVLAAEKGKSVIIKLSQRERRFLARLMGTQNLKLACAEIDIDLDAGRAFIRRKNVALYLEEKLKEVALSQDTTLSNNLAWLRRVRDGASKATKEQLDAAKTIARIHKPVSVGTVVKVQQNNISGETAVPNPYAGMDMAAIIEQSKEALNVVERRSGSTP